MPITKPIIWIMDTSVFTNLLDVPKYNQSRKDVLAQFAERIKNGDTFLMPYAAIVETGNPIAKIDARLRKPLAEKFIKEVKAALEEKSPWKPIKFPTHQDLITWMDSFPNLAQEGKGFGDFSIIKEWEEQCSLFPNHSVRIWSFDSDLQGYQS